MDKRWRFFRNIAASLLDSILAARAGCRWIFAEGLNKKHTTSPSGDIAVRARCPDQIVNMGLGTASAIKPLATFRRKNALPDTSSVTEHATDMVFGGDFACV